MANVCLDCIGEPVLAKKLAKRARKRKCAVCSRTERAIAVSALAAFVKPTLEKILVHGEDEAHYSAGDDRPDWVQSGESLSDVLAELLGVDSEIAEELATELHDTEDYDPYDQCAERFYSMEQRYKVIDHCHLDDELCDRWDAFVDTLRHRRRFFDEASVKELNRLFGGRGAVDAGRLATWKSEPGRVNETFFRGRIARTQEEASLFVRAPEEHLAPPPRELASVGRMNPRGIPVFYGALSTATVIAELRPPVGTYVVVAQFRATRVLTLLDLSKIAEYGAGSPFADDYEIHVGRARFFAGLHHRVIDAVLPGAEELHYLPTQALADYVANILGLDGILYGSSQVDPIPKPWEDDAADMRKFNIVLFSIESQPTEYVARSAKCYAIDAVSFVSSEAPWIGREDVIRSLQLGRRPSGADGESRPEIAPVSSHRRSSG